MGVKVTAGNCLHWSRPLLPHAPSSPQTLASIFSSISSKRRGTDGLSCHISHRSPFLGTSSAKLSRRRSSEDLKGRGRRSKISQYFLRRALSASLDNFADDDDDDNDEADEEFVRRLQELALNLKEDCNYNNFETLPVPDSRNQEAESASTTPSSFSSSSSYVGSPIGPLAERPWPAIRPEPPNWLDMDEVVLASVEMKANSVDLPLSLRIIKRKKRWEEGFREAGESACCSVKKAFSSMVFIVRELQSYTLQMREILFYENLQGILARVQGEMNASFVWLFQQIFSCTPTLMVYVMLLLANFTVYSIGGNFAIAAVSSNPPTVAIEQEYQQTQQSTRFDASSSIKSFSVGGNGGGGGGKVKPIAGATDDNGRSDGSSFSYSSSSSSIYGRTNIPDGMSTTGAGAGAGGVEESEKVMEEEEKIVWSRIVEEASRMQGSSRDESLMDSDTLQQLVSPVTVEMEAEDFVEYSQTELMYHQALSQDPDNVLLLSNFAQFLYLVLHDHDR